MQYRASSPAGLIPYAEVSHWRRALHVTAFFLLGLYATWANAPLTRPITIDNQIYYFISEQVADGVPPHVSLVDHKHALSSLISGAAIAVGRVFGADDVFAARAVSVVLAALVAPALWIVAYRLTRNAVVAHVTAAMMLTFGDYFVQGAMGVRPQVFMTAFVVLAFAALAHELFALAGALAVAAFLCWQPALLVFATMLAALALAGRPWRPVVRCLGGGIAVLLLYESYFVAKGALREQLYQSYAMASSLHNYVFPPLGESIHFVLRGGTWGASWWVLVPALYLAFLLALGAEAYTRPGEMFASARRNPLATALTLSALLTLAFTFIDHQAYPDRYFIQPFVALTNGIVIGWALCRATRALVVSEIAQVRLSGVVFLVLLIATAASIKPLSLRRSAGLDGQRVQAARVQRIRRRYGSVWAVGCPHLLALARQPNYDPLGLVIDPRVRAYAAKRGIDGVYRPRGGEMPAVILGARNGFRQAFPWLTTEYRKVPDPALNRQGVVVWVRRECITDRPCTNALTCPVTAACGGTAG